MFLGLQWYWWLLIVLGVMFIIGIPIKIKVLKWLNERQREQKKNQLGKWCEDE